MNFFEAQKKARNSTFKLIILFFLGVAGIIISTYFVIIFALDAGSETEYTLPPLTIFDTQIDPFWVIGLGISLLIGMGTLYKILQLSKGGAYIATSLGGRLISNNTQDLHEKKLLNVVEEMSIASGMPVPPVYLLDEEGINAFAAGNTFDDAVLGITKGAITTLSRDEIQGVIAHEFSHIFNGDMRLNLRIMGILHGILLIGLIGRSLLRSMQHTPVRQTKKGNDGKSGLLILGLGFITIGYIGYLVGEWIKAMISRQREYLADASAVQYTRNPDGIGGALKKISLAQEGSKLKTPNAQAFSHAFFSDAVKNFWDTLFATHPPLKERILRIDPAWNGTYPLKKETDSQTKKQPSKHSPADQAATLAAILAGLHIMGRPQEKHLDYARRHIQKLPPQLLDHLHEPLGSQSVILALLTAQEPSFKKEQTAFLRANDPMMLETYTLVHSLLDAVDERDNLILIYLAMPSLKALSKASYKKFRVLCEHFIHIDDTRSLFEWILEQLVIQVLDIHYQLKKRPIEIHHFFHAVKAQSDIILSFIAQSHQSDAQAIKAFETLKQNKPKIQATFIPRSTISLEKLSLAILQIQKSSAQIRNELLEAAIICIRQDQKITSLEIELIHALAALFYLPLPPLVDLMDYEPLKTSA